MVQAAFVRDKKFPSARINRETETREIGPTFSWGQRQLEIWLHYKHVKRCIALISFLCRFPSCFPPRAYMLQGGAVVVTYVLVTLRVRDLASGMWWFRWEPNTIGFVTGSRMNCRVTTVEGLPSSTGLNSSWQVFQHSIIGVPLSGVASSARQDTGNQSQQPCLHIPRNPSVTNSTDRSISSQVIRKGFLFKGRSCF